MSAEVSGCSRKYHNFSVYLEGFQSLLLNAYFYKHIPAKRKTPMQVYWLLCWRLLHRKKHKSKIYPARMRGLGITVLKILNCESYVSVFNPVLQHKVTSSTSLKDIVTQKLHQELFCRCRCGSFSRGTVTDNELQQSFTFLVLICCCIWVRAHFGSRCGVTYSKGFQLLNSLLHIKGQNSAVANPGDG